MKLPCSVLRIYHCLVPKAPVDSPNRRHRANAYGSV